MATVDELKAKLQEVSDALHQEFTGPGAVDRMAQFDSHMQTCKMALEHLFDEAERMEAYRG